ncbi:MAG: hypothetical protein MUE40_00005, partial [Anaerolineae bacterium]|nr:hypothetical protein [Anaerolineae bacterium]
DAPLSGLLIVQSTDPNASPFSAPPQQAMQIVVWVGFVLFNIVGFALTLALFFWLMNRSLARNRAGTGATPAATDKTTE